MADMKLRGHEPKTIFALLALVTVMLCLNLRALTDRSNPLGSQRRLLAAEQLPSWPRDSTEHKFMDAEYGTIVSEIRERNNQEHLLFALKFALVGGILYAALQAVAGRGQVRLERTTFAALVVWMAVIAAAVVDVRIAANQEFIGVLGKWVRRYEELKLGWPHVGVGWEAFLADERVHSTLRLSGQILTALLFCAAAGLFLLPKHNDNEPAVAVVSGISASVALILMTLAATRFRLTSPASGTYATLGLVGVGLAGMLAYISACEYFPTERVSRPEHAAGDAYVP